MNQLQTDKTVVANYKDFLGRKLAELTAVIAKNEDKEMPPRLLEAVNKIIAGINLELQYVNFRDTQLDQQLNGTAGTETELVDEANAQDGIKVSRTLN